MGGDSPATIVKAGHGPPAPARPPPIEPPLLGAAGLGLSPKGFNRSRSRVDETAGGTKRKRVPAGRHRGRGPGTKRPGRGRPRGGGSGSLRPGPGSGRSPAKGRSGRPGPAWGAGVQRGPVHGGVTALVVCFVVVFLLLFFSPVFAESKELNPVPVKFGGLISVNNASKASLGPREARRWGIKTIWERINLPRRRGRSGAMAAGPEPEPGRRAGTSPSLPQPGPHFYHHHHGYYFKFWRVRNQPPAAQLARTTGALNGRSRQCLNLYLPEPCKARNNLHSINCFSIGHRLELKDATTLP